MHVQLKGKGNNFYMLFDSDIQDNNLRAYINMIKCSSLMFFDMPAWYAWGHKQRIFDMPYKHYHSHQTNQRGL